MTLDLPVTTTSKISALVAFGQTLTGIIALPGELDAHTFVAGTGDIVLVEMGDDDAIGPFRPEIRLYAPEGSLLTSNWSTGDHVEITQTLASAGTHLLLVGDQRGTATAGYGLYVQRLNGPGYSAPIAYGQTLTGTIDLLAEIDTYTFAAQAGDIVLIEMGDDDAIGPFEPEFRLYAPDGSLVTSNWSNGDHVQITGTLSSTGTHTLLVGDHLGTATVGYGVYVQRLNGPGHVIPIAYGQTLTGTIALLAEIDTYTFTAQAGDIVLASVSDDDAIGPFRPEIRLYAPDGSLLTSNWSTGDHVEITQSLTTDGTHTLLVGDQRGIATAGCTVYLQCLNCPSPQFFIYLPVVLGSTLSK